MGADRFQRFVAEAEKRALECVRDSKNLPLGDAKGFQGKASVLEKAVNAIVKLESLQSLYLDEELAAAKLAEALASVRDRDEANDGPRVIIIDAPDDPPKPAPDEGAPGSPTGQ